MILWGQSRISVFVILASLPGGKDDKSCPAELHFCLLICIFTLVLIPLCTRISSMAGMEGSLCWAQFQLVWRHSHNLLWHSEASGQAVLQHGLKAAFLEISLLDPSPNVSDGTFWKIIYIIFVRKGSCSYMRVSHVVILLPEKVLLKMSPAVLHC